MKIRCYAHYAHHVKEWKELTRNPGKHLRRWACAVHPDGRGDLHDTWGFEEYDMRGARNLKGLLWVKVGTAERLVTACGVRRDCMLAKPVVEWVVRGMGEEDEKYVMRAYNLQTGMGIVRRVWQYNVRRPERAKDTDRRRTLRREYKVTGIRPYWDDGVQASSNARATKRSTSPRRSAGAVTPLGPSLPYGTTSAKGSTVDTRKQRRFEPPQGRALPNEREVIAHAGTGSASPPATDKVPAKEKPQAKDGAAKQDEDMPDAAEDNGQSGNAAERAKQTRYPEGIAPVPSEGKCDCLFLAMAKAMSGIEGRPRKRHSTPGRVRQPPRLAHTYRTGTARLSPTWKGPPQTSRRTRICS